MKSNLLSIIVLLTVTSFFAFPLMIAAQVNLGVAASYCVFTGTGALTNTGASHFAGNLGTNDGAISGFELPATISGEVVSPGTATAAVKADLISACAELHSLTVTTPEHAVTFGNGETIMPGVHFVSAAASLEGALTLDANGNSNAIFVFRIGGAFSTSAYASIILVNEARAENVYFIVNGEILIATGGIMKGNLIANDGAASLGFGASLEGRLMSVTGAVTMDAVDVSLPANILLADNSIQALTVISQPFVAILKWKVSPGQDVKSFGIERASKNLVFHQIEKVDAGTDAAAMSYQWQDNNPLSDISYYRIRSVSSINLVMYSEIIKIRRNIPPHFVIYPNPITEHSISILFKGRPAGQYLVQIYSCTGVAIIQKVIAHSGIDRSWSVSINKNFPYGGGYLTITDPHHTKLILSFLSISN